MDLTTCVCLIVMEQQSDMSGQSDSAVEPRTIQPANTALKSGKLYYAAATLIQYMEKKV